MIIELKEQTYYIHKFQKGVIISNEKTHIEFQETSNGWLSFHGAFDDEMFPEKDIWCIINILDRIYSMRNQIN